MASGVFDLSTLKCDKPGDADAFLLGKAPDHHLVQEAINGNEEAFACLYRRYRDKIFLLCLDYSKGDRAQANDLCQEAFISAFENLQQLRNASLFHFWLHEIAKNKCLSFKRKENAFVNALKDYAVIKWMGEEERDWSAAELQLVVDIIHGMEDSEFKETVRLYYVEGKNSREVAEIQNITQTLVTTRLNRFRARFSKRIVREILKLRESRL